MPTNRPRVYVTLHQETYDAFKAVSENNGESMSSLLAELADIAAPTYRRVAEHMEKAKTLDAYVKRELAGVLDDAQEHFESAVDTLFKELPEPLARELKAVVSESITGPATAGTGSDSGNRPHSTNRGATFGN